LTAFLVAISTSPSDCFWSFERFGSRACSTKYGESLLFFHQILIGFCWSFTTTSWSLITSCFIVDLPA
jgi:hypothetical protein